MNKHMNKNKNKKIHKFVLGTAVGILATGAVQAQEQNTDTKSDEEVEVINVSGIRSGLARSAQIKRNSDTVVEAITFEDFGLYLDDNVVDSLERVAGVQVERDVDGGGGDRVSVRGLGPKYVATTVNGRRFLSSGDNGFTNLRSSNLGIFPPGVLTGVRIAKGQTADRPESGLGGQVDLLTPRPLDMGQLYREQYFATATVRQQYKDLAGDTGNRFNFINGWRNEDSTLGLFGAFLVDDTDSQTHSVIVPRYDRRSLMIDTSPEDGILTADETLTDILMPSNVISQVSAQESKRVAASAALQYRPTNNIDIVVDGTYSRYKRDAFNSFVNDATVLGGGRVFTQAIFPSSAVEIDADNVLRYADFNQASANPTFLRRPSGVSITNDSENTLLGANVEWTLDTLTANVDVFYSKSEYEQLNQAHSVLFQETSAGHVYDNTGVLPGIVDDDPNRIFDTDYIFANVTALPTEFSGESSGVTLDFDYEIDTGPVSSLDFGVQFENVEINVDRGVNFNIRRVQEFQPAILIDDGTGTLIQDTVRIADFDNVALVGVLSDEFFPSEPGLVGVSTFPIVSQDAIFAAYPEVRALVDGALAEFERDPERSHETEEQITSAYLQANIDTELFDLSFSGNVGVRVVNTELNSAAATIELDGSLTPNSVLNDYTKVLPSFNFRLNLTDDMLVRFGASKTLSRPEYEETAPTIRVREPSDDFDDSEADLTLFRATAGNPDLDPTTSTNVDLTFEYYGTEGGVLAASLFYKDVKDVILSIPVAGQLVPGQGDQLFNVTRPENYSDATVKGLEIGFTQSLDEFLDIKGFGVQANYTRVESELERVLEDVTSRNRVVGLPGVSEDNFNIVAFYEGERLTVRTTYTFRSDYFSRFVPVGGSGEFGAEVDALFSGETENLTANIGYKLTDNLNVTVSGVNLTNDYRRDTFGGFDGAFARASDVGRTYRVDLRYKF